MTRIIYHTDELEMLPEKFYLFGFGANNVENLAKRFFGHIEDAPTKQEIKVVDYHSSPGLVEGWKRIFFGHSKKWSGSVGSLTRDKNSEVMGVLTFITRKGKKFYLGEEEINLEGLFIVEAVDRGMYRFEPISCIDGYLVYAFIGNEDAFPAKAPPSESYLNAIRKTVAYSGVDSSKIDIPIEYE